MFYKKILIISDNSFLCKEIENITLKKGLHFDFSISPFSDLNDFKKVIKSNISIFDLREEKDINHIISNYDLVISIHCKQIFPDLLVNSIKCINIHPGYNPINRGWYPQVFSIINDLPVGATIHEIDTELDHGNIIAREFVNIENTDTSGTLYDRILEKEIKLFEENIDTILENSYRTITPENEGNIFFKKDFNNLCKLNLDEYIKVGDFIKKLRALTHKEYKNAYFIDPITNEKIYISISMSK